MLGKTNRIKPTTANIKRTYYILIIQTLLNTNIIFKNKKMDFFSFSLIFATLLLFTTTNVSIAIVQQRPQLLEAKLYQDIFVV